MSSNDRKKAPREVKEGAAMKGAAKPNRKYACVPHAGGDELCEYILALRSTVDKSWNRFRSANDLLPQYQSVPIIVIPGHFLIKY